MLVRWVKRVLHRMKKKSLPKEEDAAEKCSIRLIKANRFKSSRVFDNEVCDEDDISSHTSTSSSDFSESLASSDELDESLEKLRARIRNQKTKRTNLSEMDELEDSMFEDLIGADQHKFVQNLILKTHSQFYSNTFAFSKVPNVDSISGFYSSNPYSQYATRYCFRTSVCASTYYQTSTNTVFFERTYEEEISFDESQ